MLLPAELPRRIKQPPSSLKVQSDSFAMFQKVVDPRFFLRRLRASSFLTKCFESSSTLQDHLQNLSSSLSLRLSYFDVLQPSTILLSSPSLSLVLSPDFLHMLDRLDVALAFIRAHPHYRDSNLYKMRFEGCLIRAGTLIKMWITGKIKETGGVVSTSVGQKDSKVQVSLYRLSTQMSYLLTICHHFSST